MFFVLIIHETHIWRGWKEKWSHSLFSVFFSFFSFFLLARKKGVYFFLCPNTWIELFFSSFLLLFCLKRVKYKRNDIWFVGCLNVFINSRRLLNGQQMGKSFQVSTLIFTCFCTLFVTKMRLKHFSWPITCRQT